MLTATPSSTVTSSAHVSGQSCGQAARTILRSTGAFLTGASMGRGAILRRSGAYAGGGPEACAQHLRDAVVRVARGGERAAHRQESVDHPLEALVDDRNARFAEPIGIGLSLVAQGVEPAGEDVRGGKARMVMRAQRRCAPVGVVALVAQILLLVPAQELAGERIAGGETPERLGVGRLIDHGVDEHLHRE